MIALRKDGILIQFNAEMGVPASIDTLYSCVEFQMVLAIDRIRDRVHRRIQIYVPDVVFFRYVAHFPRPRGDRVIHLAEVKDCIVRGAPSRDIVLHKVRTDATIVFVVGATGHPNHILEASGGSEEISPVWSGGRVTVPGDIRTAGVVGRFAKLE